MSHWRKQERVGNSGSSYSCVVYSSNTKNFHRYKQMFDVLYQSWFFTKEKIVNTDRWEIALEERAIQYAIEHDQMEELVAELGNNTMFTPFFYYLVTFIHRADNAYIFTRYRLLSFMIHLHPPHEDEIKDIKDNEILMRPHKIMEKWRERAKSVKLIPE